jgi:hypothetical protein
LPEFITASKFVVNPHTVLSGPALALQILHADGALYVIEAVQEGAFVN